MTSRGKSSDAVSVDMTIAQINHLPVVMLKLQLDPVTLATWWKQESEAPV